jgi:hypothetical protein
MITTLRKRKERYMFILLKATPEQAGVAVML